MNPWFRMANHAALLMWDAQQVMALRLMRMAAGGPAASRELETMVGEKLISSEEAQVAGMAALAEGKSLPAIGEKVLRVHKKRVKANRRRLSKRKK